MAYFVTVDRGCVAIAIEYGVCGEFIIIYPKPYCIYLRGTISPEALNSKSVFNLCKKYAFPSLMTWIQPTFILLCPGLELGVQGLAFGVQGL